MTGDNFDYHQLVIIAGYFDHLDHEWIMKTVGVHIKDPNILRLIKKFLKAGIMEENVYYPTEEGAAQGSNLSPLIANIYMHYMLILWFHKVFKQSSRGYCSIIVYADDFVGCFQYKSDAEMFDRQLKDRLKMFGLELEASKTHLIRFGRFAEVDMKKKAESKPETFDFLGFTHYCGKSRSGRFRVKRKTSKKKYRVKVANIKNWLMKNRTLPLKVLMEKLNKKLHGHYQYYGITDNIKMLRRFYYETEKLLYKWLNRRSQRNSYNYEKFKMLLAYYPLEKPKIFVNIYDN